MVREFKLPDVGEGLTEAEIVDWLVDPGDTVSEDQPVAEVETDKAVVEVPAPVDGTVREILAEEGEMVPVGDVIITFDVEGEPVQEDPTGAEAAGGAESDGEAAAEAGTADASDVSETEGRVFAAPSARRVARELGVDIGSVGGSAPGGRVTEADVRTAAESDGEAAATADVDSGVTSATRRVDADEEAAPPTAQDADGATPVDAADRDRTLAAPATRKLAEEEGVDIDAVPTDETKDGEPFVTDAHVREYAEAQRQAQAADAEAVAAGADAEAPAGGPSVEAGGDDERVPYRGVRRTIGQQMERSKFTAPHVTHHDEVDVTRLVEARGRLKERAEERGTKLTYMPFVVKAVVAGLKEHPILNSQLDEDNEEIVIRGDYNIGVATATDAGLMVPVVKNADRKGMLEIADGMRELIDAARERSITPEQMQDGTFTITNFGAIGGEYATPIINYPETGILGLGAIKDRPWVVDGEVEARKVMTLSLSIDHRVIDGADAAQFVNTVKEYLADPELLLLE
jgi:pyruvate dehydrogenase E2 component (dihydrolipoamide acetyltransferase)